MKENKSKLRTHLTAVLTYSAICLLWGCATHTGSRNGQVFDGLSNMPIEGAVVSYTWRYEGFLEDAIVGRGGEPVTYETVTDKEGEYFIPDMTIERKSKGEIGLRPEMVIVYKDKYGAYILFSGESVGITFGEKERQSYLTKNNLVKLYPWRDGESHEKHVDWIGGWTLPPQKNGLLLKELGPEKKRAREEALAKHK
jgi:hypothetical protein